MFFFKLVGQGADTIGREVDPQVGPLARSTLVPPLSGGRTPRGGRACTQRRDGKT